MMSNILQNKPKSLFRIFHNCFVKKEKRTKDNFTKFNLRVLRGTGYDTSFIIMFHFMYAHQVTFKIKNKVVLCIEWFYV